LPAKLRSRRTANLSLTGACGLVQGIMPPVPSLETPAGLLALVAALVTGAPASAGAAEPPVAPRPAGPLTFTRDIAPIVFQECAGCHRPGAPGPFSLLAYADVKKRARQMAEVTASRQMPPWLPDQGRGELVGARRLTTNQIGMIQQWVAEGAGEGAAADLPSLPHWTEGWQLGQPDVIVKLTNAYTLGPDGRDVYRMFVLPIPTSTRRYVRGIELHPGSKTVHHAFLRIDRTRQSRRLDDEDPGPGFTAMNPPVSAISPGGHFLGWQPGRLPNFVPDGLAWTLEPGSDLVVQMHLQPSGKPERVQPEVGFYFTDRAPTNTPFKVGLSSYDIDIPAGATNYVVRDEYTLPIDAEVLAVLPHAHYLGKDLQGLAILPDGTTRELLHIRQWDFNWQGDYRYVHPISLPKGTRLAMQFSYDNSAGNPRNSSQPPKPVKYGVQSADEMGELWLQMLARSTNDFETVSQDLTVKIAREVVSYNEYLLRANPNDARAHNHLGVAFMSQRRLPEALQHFRAAARLQPEYDEAHYHLGVIYQMQGKIPNARLEFERAIACNPDYFKAHNNLANIYMAMQNLTEAEKHLRTALQINPEDPIARGNLDAVLKARSGAK